MKHGTLLLAVVLAAVINSTSMATTRNVSPLFTAATPGYGSTAFTSIQAAITASADNDVISIGTGTYYETLRITKPLTLIGATDKNLVVLDATGLAGDAILSSANNVTIKNFTVQANAENTLGDFFGVKAIGTKGNTTPAAQDGIHATGIDIEDMIVLDAYAGGIDLNGIDGATIANVLSTGSLKGQGIGLTDCKNITMSGITTGSNNLSGIRMTASGKAFKGGIDHIVLGAGNNISETASEAYSEIDNAAYTVTNLDFTASALRYRAFKAGNNTIAYWSNKTKAQQGVIFTGEPGAVADIGADVYYVADMGSFGQMKIQDAINAAPAGSVLNIDPGTYAQTVTINKNLVINPVAYTPIATPFFVGTPGLVITNLVMDNAGGYTSLSPLKITGTLSFVHGNINTTNKTFIELADGATISGETGSAMVIGDVHVERALHGSLASPAGSTFGNIGFEITNVRNDINTVMIVRRTGPAGIVTVGSAKSIARSWHLSGTGAALTLPMTVTVSWLPSENNGLPVSAVLFNSQNASIWSIMSTIVPIGHQTLTDQTSLFEFFAVGDPDAPLPVELTAFTAQTAGKKVMLSWSTATEMNNRGFDVERRAANGAWQTLGFVQGAGTTNAPRSYAYTDMVMAGTYEYRLKQTDNDGAFTYSTTVEAIAAFTAEDYAVSQNYPNPFNPTTNIRFAVKTAQHAVVKIFNAIGQEVRTLFNETAQPETLYSLTFDATGLASGSYYYMLRTTDRTEVKRMVLVK